MLPSLNILPNILWNILHHTFENIFVYLNVKSKKNSSILAYSVEYTLNILLNFNKLSNILR